MRDLDAKLVVTVEDLKSATTLGDETVTVDENTVNVEGESHVLGLLDLLSLDGLDLRDQELPGRLDGGHTRTDSGMMDGGETGLSVLGPGDRQRSAKGVTGGSSVSHGGRDAQVVHVLGSLGDGGASGGDLDGTTRLLIMSRDGQNVVVGAVVAGGGHLAEGAGAGGEEVSVVVGGHVLVGR